MKLFKNKVGRPSNKIIKKRKIFITSVIIAILAVIFIGGYALLKPKTTKMVGASNGNSYINMSVLNSNVSISACNMTIPVNVTNKQNKSITITSAQIHYVSGNAMQTIKVNKSIAKKSSARINLPFLIDKFTNVNRTDYKVTLFFKISGKSTEYYKYDLYTANSNVKKTVSNCISRNGWYQDAGSWYYYKSGKRLYGWQELKYSKGTSWFYFDTTTGKMYANTCKNISGVQYCFNKDGAWVPKTFTLTCPNAAEINLESNCSANVAGVTYKLSTNGLVSSYKSNETVSSSGGIKKFKYNKPVTITVTASKAGYKTQVKSIKIQNEVVNNNFRNYTVSTKTIVKTNVKGAMPALTRGQVNKIIEKAGKDGILKTSSRKVNAKKISEKVLEIQEKYKINAAFTLAVAIQESGMGTANTGCVKKNNWFSIMSNGSCVSYKNPNESVERFGKLISGTKYFGASKTTPATIGPRYCCSSWAGTITSHMNSLIKWIK